MYVRIKPPTSIKQDVPQRICSGGATVVQGGPGVEVKNNSIIARIKKIAGRDNIEVSKKPFEVAAPKGGTIDLDAMKMKEPEGDGAEGDDE